MVGIEKLHVEKKPSAPADQRFATIDYLPPYVTMKGLLSRLSGAIEYTVLRYRDNHNIAGRIVDPTPTTNYTSL